ncbi:uncharacterized protein Z519_00999 [Cladophialophora bantiana CBS 173.52]|uniref:BRCT domain-containing protein n=1 Tax=Cladophialophora bantiana (strain ATCC 10958 / CBS 173.52 / CDC B-1940 / NIH 8579) TaxID=1442370 RepID=A0A0D2FB50_CLAB1|nr:uncharacterized protein Z519_00999 [Cladophialophora bantiana CBS 173.52]KIW99336.1 hypothetical protein Z519_00999 [Cladophialophora bantiana CBS 173.52]
MATDSLLSIDIAAIKADILAPLESGHKRPDSEHNLHTEVQDTTECDIQTPFPDTEPASVPELPSTVPDSQLIVTNVESQLQFLPSAFASNKPVATTQKMTSQGSDAPTQELSPSRYEHLINQSRSARHLEDQEYDLGLDQELDEETGATLHEGDEGHVDLISSLVSQKGAASDEEEEDAEPAEVDSSPTKSPRALSQFPESQRFKTPATAGRKRRFNGDVVDSPGLPRNPLLRGSESRAHVMGLSQAFAATQANTSPFVGDNGDLHSDRPSPNIELQPRPMTAATSSPLRPISDFKRASTEPASRYVSVKQSQALRERARRQHAILNEGQDSDQDSFDGNEDSFLDRERRQLERNRKIQAQLSSISKRSMRSISLSKSSPILGPTRTSPESAVPLKWPRIPSDSSPIRHDRQISGNESEEETEQEDNTSVAVTRSSQPMMAVDEEDKENVSDRASRIPETTARLHRVMTDIPMYVQDSPLLRHGPGIYDHAMALSSPQLFAVADSQPERSLKPRRTTTQVPRSSTADEGLDFVPQSPTSSSPRATPTNREPAASGAPVHHTVAAADEYLTTEKELRGTVVDGIVLESNSQTHQPQTSTVPETSSNEQQIQSDKDSDARPQPVVAESHEEFDTAQTHKLASTAAEQPAPTDLSSPPILTTPPGQRRKRLAEIAAEPSPSKSPVSFDASEALQLDPNFQSPIGRSLPPGRINRRVSKEVEVSAGRSDSRQGRNPSKEPESNEASDLSKDHKDCGKPSLGPANGCSEGPVQAVSPPITYSRRERRPTMKALSAISTRPRIVSSTARSSEWSLGDPPPQKDVSISKPSAKMEPKAKHNGLSEEITSTLNNRLESVKTAALETPLLDDIQHQQDSADPIGFDESASLNAMAEPEAHDEAESDSSERKIAPNMVFACFNGKSRAYHPAICLGRPYAESRRFLIQWEGYDPDEVDEHGVRSLDLRIGDQVKIDMQGFPKVSHVIRGFKNKIMQANIPTDQAVVTDIRGYRTLVVAPKQRKSMLGRATAESVKKVPISAIYLDSIMWGQMKDRVYQYKPSIQAVLSFGISTPLDRASTPSTPSSRTRRGMAAMGPSAGQIDLTNSLFRKMAFAISYEDNNRKRCLMDLVQSNGGVILQESFLDLFKPDSVLLKEEFSGFSFAALLADRHSRKEKYLQALALGLPCLSGKWLELCVKSDKIIGWESYLLPAGDSAELEGATRSRILPLSASAEDLRVKDIINLRPKILTDSQVVVVMGKGKAEAKRRPYLSLVRALDPATLDLESDLMAVKARLETDLGDSETVKYVFVDDREVEAAKATFLTSTSNKKGIQPERDRKRGKRKHERGQEHEDGDAKLEARHAGVKVEVMCNEDIVQSLILGKLWIG